MSSSAKLRESKPRPIHEPFKSKVEAPEKNSSRCFCVAGRWNSFWGFPAGAPGKQCSDGRGETKRIRRLSGNQRRGQSAAFRHHHGSLQRWRFANHQPRRKRRKGKKGRCIGGI